MQVKSLVVLENAGVAPVQALAIVRAIEIEVARAKDTLATKQDAVGIHHSFDVPCSELRADMAALGATLRVEMAQQFGEVRKELAGVTRQMYLALLGQTAVILGFLFLVVEMR